MKTSNLALSFLFPFFLILYEFCVNLSTDMYLPALPSLQQEFSVSFNAVQFTIAAWIAGDFSLQFFTGPLADHYGKRTILLIGGVLFLISTIVCALAPSISLFTISRFVQGMGVGIMMVAGYACIHDTYDDKKAIHILAVMGSIAVIAPAIGPTLGGILLLYTNWRSIFFLLFYVSLMSLIGLWFFMPKSPKTTERLNFKSVLRSYSHLLFHADFMLAVSAFSSLFAGLVGWITMSPYLLMENLKLSPIEFGWLQIPIFGSNMLGAMLVKPLLEKIEKEKMIFYGTLISFLSGLMLIAFSLIFPNQLISFILPMSIYAFGFGLSSSSLSRMVYITTTQKHGIVASAFNLMMVGFAALISTLVSLFNETAVTASIVIAMTAVLAFLFNQIRQKNQKLL